MKSSEDILSLAHAILDGSPTTAHEVQKSILGVLILVLEQMKNSPSTPIEISNPIDDLVGDVDGTIDVHSGVKHGSKSRKTRN